MEQQGEKISQLTSAVEHLVLQMAGLLGQGMIYHHHLPHQMLREIGTMSWNHHREMYRLKFPWARRQRRRNKSLWKSEVKWKSWSERLRKPKG